MTPSRRHLTGPTCLAVLVLALAGCGDEAPGTTSKPLPATAPPTSSVPTAVSSGATTSPAASPTSPDAPPGAATGAEVDLEGIRLNLPVSWSFQKIGKGIGASAPGGAYIMAIDVASAIEPDITMTDFAKGWRMYTLYPMKEKLADEVSVAGQPWFHLTGQTNGSQYSDEYGTVTGDTSLVMSIDSMLTIDPAERQATIDSILAGVVLEP